MNDKGVLIDTRAHSRSRVLLIAYGCEPFQGSEPGIGWGWATHLSQYEDVWVLTRASNEASIRSSLAESPVPGAEFRYYDVPRWLTWWKRGLRGVGLYYYLWQIGAYFQARRLHKDLGFDLVRHVTWVKYAVPSFCSLLPVPFVWGPVGGGVNPPKSFRATYAIRGRVFERARDLARWIGERDPFVRLTARRSVCALANTEETADSLRRLGARKVALACDSGLTARQFAELEPRGEPREGPFRVLSAGRLVHWKAVHLGLEAFSAADLGDAEYWILGDGPERGRLQGLAQALGIEDRVRFLGMLPRDDVLRLLHDCDVLLHPSLHDSGGVTCLEGMAAGKPVVCLDIGGPGSQVTDATGVRVGVEDPRQVVRDLSAALKRLEDDPAGRASMGKAGREVVASTYLWEVKAAVEHHRHDALLNEGLGRSKDAPLESTSASMEAIR